MTSAYVAGAMAIHNRRRTWKRYIDLFLALTSFSRRKVVSYGLPPERVIIKPNSVSDPGIVRREWDTRALYVGRLALEKGPKTAVEAFNGLGKYKLDIIGTGPLGQCFEKLIGKTSNIRICGGVSQEEVLKRMRRASFLVVPSLWYEMQPRVIIEAMACGVPVLASKIGGLQEIVQHGKTGLVFRPGDPLDLRTNAIRLFEAMDENRAMGINARMEYERNYTPERNVDMLLGCYRKAIASRATLG
jgi:glycosyltransferase involved in cell wall biosynthesis